MRLENSGLKIASAQLETLKIPAINPGLHENYTKSKQKEEWKKESRKRSLVSLPQYFSPSHDTHETNVGILQTRYTIH